MKINTGLKWVNCRILNLFVLNALFLYSLKTYPLKTILQFSDVFRGYRKGALGTNELIIKCFIKAKEQQLDAFFSVWC